MEHVLRLYLLQGLTDRTYLARHLPPADVPVKPPEAQVRQLFKRPDGLQKLSKKSTCLFRPSHKI